MNEEYQFTGVWQPYPATGPSTGTRCLITDGDLVMFGTYIADGTGNTIWLIPEFNSDHPFNVIGWMDTPKPMKKRVVYDETNVGKN